MTNYREKRFLSTKLNFTSFFYNPIFRFALSCNSICWMQTFVPVAAGFRFCCHISFNWCVYNLDTLEHFAHLLVVHFGYVEDFLKPLWWFSFLSLFWFFFFFSCSKNVNRYTVICKDAYHSANAHYPMSALFFHFVLVTFRFSQICLTVLDSFVCCVFILYFHFIPPRLKALAKLLYFLVVLVVGAIAYLSYGRVNVVTHSDS